MAQKKRGRPQKQPVAQKITSALDVAQEEINSLLPVEEQESLVPAVITPEVIEEPAPFISKDAKDDYEYARTNLHSLLEKGNRLLEGISDLAGDSDHPRTYEVAGNLLKTLLEGTRELMTLQKDIREVNNKGTNEQGNQPVTIEHANEVTNNTMIVEGTTQEMLEVIREMKRKKLEQQEVKDNN